jgi:hypothetical protein
VSGSKAHNAMHSRDMLRAATLIHTELEVRSVTENGSDTSEDALSAPALVQCVV